jgi:hypothetical protein
MSAYPVQLAAGLALIAFGAQAEESPNAKTAEPDTKSAMTRNVTPDEAGLSDQPVQLPVRVVDGDELRNHMKRVNQELQEAFQREAMAPSHTLYEKPLTKNTAVDLLSVLLVARQMIMDNRTDAIPGAARDQGLSPPEDVNTRVATVPILRSTW